MRDVKKIPWFIQFEIGIQEMENRCNSFAERGKTNIDWALNQIIRLLHFQKEFHTAISLGQKVEKF